MYQSPPADSFAATSLRLNKVPKNSLFRHGIDSWTQGYYPTWKKHVILDGWVKFVIVEILSMKKLQSSVHATLPLRALHY